MNSLDKRFLNGTALQLPFPRGTRPTSMSTHSRAGASKIRRLISCVCTMNAAPSRASKISSAAKHATPSPNTTLSKSCAPIRTANHSATRPSRAVPPVPSASSPLRIRPAKGREEIKTAAAQKLAGFGLAVRFPDQASKLQPRCPGPHLPAHDQRATPDCTALSFRGGG